ncbi:hypothetical protein V9K67_22110 [Paraflavisolibacter sp. H34]|uniref:hypothetical protein n=1 Tax=Huijunlia imazamoxiresistens TaxID=3127457 RepID=UPI00301B3B7C
MKKLVAILLLVIMALTMFAQCCTEDNCCLVKPSASASHCSDGDEDGACSPFSSCSTCLGFIPEVHTVALPEPPSPALRHYSPEGVPALPTTEDSFWQPPRA